MDKGLVDATFDHCFTPVSSFGHSKDVQLELARPESNRGSRVLVMEHELTSERSRPGLLGSPGEGFTLDSNPDHELMTNSLKLVSC